MYKNTRSIKAGALRIQNVDPYCTQSLTRFNVFKLFSKLLYNVPMMKYLSFIRYIGAQPSLFMHTHTHTQLLAIGQIVRFW